MANRILLADDSITIQKVVNLTFSDEGIDVVTVGNGDLALKKLREEAFDLVLADIFMPGTDGYKLCEFIKSQPDLSHVPVILLVGAFEPFDRNEAGRVRADGHLTKPFESRILVETVRRMLASVPARAPEPAAPEQSAGGWGVPAEEPQQEESEPAPPPYDPYASTAKLPPLGHVLKQQETAPGNQSTQVIGSPFSPPPRSDRPAPVAGPTGDLFHMDVTTPFVIGADPAPRSDEFDTAPRTPVIEAPAPLTFDMSPPEAPHVAIEAPPEPIAEEVPRPSPIGYQPGSLGDSPLDLDDIGTVEHHAHPTADVLEVRDPLLDNFEAVKDSTAAVDSAMDPAIVSNAQPDAESSLHVQPVDDLVSGFEQAPVEKPSVPPPPSFDSNRTQTYMRGGVPFDAAEQIAPDRTAQAYDPLKTQVYNALSAPFEAAQPAAPEEAALEVDAPQEAAEVEEAAQEIEPQADDEIAAAPAEDEAEASAPAVAASSNGAELPQDLIDEVVRRTIERMSDNVIREVAWEVVPDLAEALIRKRLSEMNR